MANLGRGEESGRIAGRPLGLDFSLYVKHSLLSGGIFVLFVRQPLQDLKSIT